MRNWIKVIIPIILLGLISGVIVVKAKENYVRRNPIEEIRLESLPKKIKGEINLCLKSHPSSKACKRITSQRRSE